MKSGNMAISIIQEWPCVLIGSTGIAIIQLVELRDMTTICVGIVTIVCLLYNTFRKRNDNNQKKE